MKRDPVNLDQLALFEPEAPEALRLMEHHRAVFAKAMDAADMWDACWCPGARDQAQLQADHAYANWLHCAIFLDLEREAAL